ncbi:MAG: DUF3426 domain-containing protein [Methylotenera sp.]|nr:DUF3426 domain-containing protein [Methylotenera sp.]
MRDITHCPNCQTQFFVSEAQLNQHGGLVRCGQCLHVFNAKEQFVAQAQPDNPIPENSAVTEDTSAISVPSITEQSNTPPSSSWPTLDHSAITEAPPSQDIQSQIHLPEKAQQTFSSTQNQTAEAIELSTVQQEEASHALDNTDAIQADLNQSSADADLITEKPDIQAHPDKQAANDITNLSFIPGNQSHYFNDLAKHAKLDGKKIANKRLRWLWILGVFLVLLIAAGQSVYFLRNTIAIYYPNLKPHLLVLCQHLHCSIELPKQIEWIIIDDSDMQEDLQHAGVMHLSSSLLNKADFVQAYPNVELTLTDINDSAVLRRIFKPVEYLAANTDIPAGFSAGREIKIKLAITTQDVSVAGYRLYVTY